MPHTRTPLCIAVHRSLLALCGAARCSPASHDGDDTAREDGAHGDHHPEVRVLAAPHLPGRSHSGWAALRHPSRPPPASLLEAPPVRGSERQCRSVGLPCLWPARHTPLTRVVWRLACHVTRSMRTMSTQTLHRPMMAKKGSSFDAADRKRSVPN